MSCFLVTFLQSGDAVVSSFIFVDGSNDYLKLCGQLFYSFSLSALRIINTIPDSQFFVDSIVCDGFITVHKIYTVSYNH